MSGVLGMMDELAVFVRCCRCSSPALLIVLDWNQNQDHFNYCFFASDQVGPITAI